MTPEKQREFIGICNALTKSNDDFSTAFGRCNTGWFVIVRLKCHYRYTSYTDVSEDISETDFVKVIHKSYKELVAKYDLGTL